MPLNPTPAKCSFPVADGVCFNMGQWVVTSQPVYNSIATQNPYVALAAAGIRSILSVRDPMETTLPMNPFDLTEAQQCVVNNISHTNVALPHVPMPQAQYQPLFNLQAYNAASVIDASSSSTPWQSPILIHCSSGDRASAAFAVFLIAYGGWTNSDATNFAQSQLALATFAPYVLGYSTP